MSQNTTKNYVNDGNPSENQATCTGFDPRKIYLLGEKHSGLKPRGVLQKYEMLKSHYLQQGKVFEDPQFNPSQVDLGQAADEIQGEIKWMRPHEIVPNPQFTINGEKRFDINQGDLGDCWFLAAVADVTSNSNLMELIVPSNQSFQYDYGGIFHFRFWQYGRWIDVVIDDRLPTYNGNLLFVRSKLPNVFWTSLLEKAYAKLYGSYKNIDGGFVSEALEDLTGGLNEIYEEVSEQSKFVNFYDLMLTSYTKKSFMGCGIIDSMEIEGSRPDGLYSRHAYSITDVTQVECKVGNLYRLLRIRNPWGKGEWNGNWSDNSKNWNLLPEDTKKDLLIRKNDGEFWMQFEDFVSTYTFLEFCHPNPDFYKRVEEEMAHWKSFMVDGAWIDGVNSGGLPNNLSFSKNPQYILKLNGPEKNKNYRILVGLMQKNRRIHNLLELSIGFIIYRLPSMPEGGRISQEFFSNRKPIYIRPTDNHKQITGHVDLTNGIYCIVPFCQSSKTNCEYLLRVYAEIDFNVEENDESVSLMGEAPVMKDAVDSSKADNAIKQVFGSFSKNGEDIGWKELKNILDLLLKNENQEFSKEICRSMVALADSDISGNLNFQEFYQLWEQIGIWRGIFRTSDADNSKGMSPSELRGALNKAGIRVNNRVLKLLVIRYSNDNGELDMEDFLHCCIKLNQMIAIYESNKSGGKLEDFLMDTLYA